MSHVALYAAFGLTWLVAAAATAIVIGHGLRRAEEQSRH